MGVVGGWINIIGSWENGLAPCRAAAWRLGFRVLRELWDSYTGRGESAVQMLELAPIREASQ